jgi:hypothetical protein
MQIMILFFAAFFAFMAVVLMITYLRTRDALVFVIAVTYGVSAGLTVALTHWWPLITGFTLIWILRLLWLDLGVREEPVREEDSWQ